MPTTFEEATTVDALNGDGSGDWDLSALVDAR